MSGKRSAAAGVLVPVGAVVRSPVEFAAEVVVQSEAAALLDHTVVPLADPALVVVGIPAGAVADSPVVHHIEAAAVVQVVLEFYNPGSCCSTSFDTAVCN